MRSRRWVVIGMGGVALPGWWSEPGASWSTREQNLARQEAALTTAGCARCFFDKASGKNTHRPELERMFDYIRPGDALTVVSLGVKEDRYSG